jgi:hypothetical protein
MPFSVSNPPDKIRKLTPKQQRQWVHVYNSCSEAGGDEKKCHMQAWGVANKDNKTGTDAKEGEDEMDNNRLGNMALRQQTQKNLSNGDDWKRREREYENKKRQKEAEKAKKKKEKERAKAEMKKYKQEHPKSKKTIGDFVKGLFSSEDCDGEIEIEVSAPGVDIEIEVKPRYRDVGMVQAELLDMAKKILGDTKLKVAVSWRRHKDGDGFNEYSYRQYTARPAARFDRRDRGWSLSFDDEYENTFPDLKHLKRFVLIAEEHGIEAAREWWA